MFTQNYIVDENKCKDAFLKNNNRLKNKWYKLNSTSNVGCMTYLYRKYNYPATYQDFFNAYVQDHKKNSKINGRSIEYLTKVASNLSILDGNKCDISIYFDYVVQKLIIDTFNGLQKEFEAKELIENHNLQVEEPTYSEDTDLAIDMKVKKNNMVKCAIQVKPHTFFLGNSNRSLVNDRRLAIKKENKVKDNLKIPVYYLIYNKNSGQWIKTESGKLLHHLNNLVNEDGTTKNVI